MKRRCPNCGAVVPDESLNCPHCYHDVPRTDIGIQTDYHNRTREQYEDQLTKRHKSHTLSLILAIIPAFIGLLGLAQIYQDYRDSTGWNILICGLLLFLLLVGMIILVVGTGGIGAVLLAVPIVIVGAIYLLLALYAFFLTNTGVVTMFGRRM